MGNDEEPIAVILASAFIEARLKTLVRELMRAQKRKVSELYGHMEFANLIKLNYAMGLINESERSKLANLASRRNDLAHNSFFWRVRTQKANAEYRRLCNDGLTFLENTGSLKRVLLRVKRLSAKGLVK